MGSDPGTYVTIAKAAALLSISPHSVAVKAAAGDLDTFEDEGRLMVSLASIERLRESA